MQRDTQNGREDASLSGRILSLEAALLLMGLVSLGYGIANSAPMNIFWGVVIIPGVFVLYKVRRKDWKAHWAALEEQQRLMQERDKEDRRGDQ